MAVKSVSKITTSDTTAAHGAVISVRRVGRRVIVRFADHSTRWFYVNEHLTVV